MPTLLHLPAASQTRATSSYPQLPPPLSCTSCLACTPRPTGAASARPAAFDEGASTPGRQLSSVDIFPPKDYIDKPLICGTAMPECNSCMWVHVQSARWCLCRHDRLQRLHACACAACMRVLV